MENETQTTEQEETQTPDPIAVALEKITALEASNGALTKKVEALENAPQSGVEITDAESINITNMLEAGNYAYAIKALHTALVQ